MSETAFAVDVLGKLLWPAGVEPYSTMNTGQHLVLSCDASWVVTWDQTDLFAFPHMSKPAYAA